jgi:hypothetical protein
MSTTLRRPMFRGGGKIESRGTGITSGLDDRPGYAEAGVVSPIDMGRVQSEAERLFELQKSMGLFDRPEEKTFGVPEYLRLAQAGFEFAGKGGDGTFFQKASEVAAPALGDIAGTIAAKKERQRELAQQEKVLKASNVGAVYEQLGKEAIQKAKTSESGYQIERKIEMIGELTTDINDLIQQLSGAEGDQKEEIQRQIDLKESQLAVLTESDPIMEAFLKSDEGEYLFGDVGQILQDTINPATGNNWEPTDPGYYAEVMRLVKETLGSSFKKGGRVKMQQGGMTTQTTPTAQQTAPANQQIETLSFADLRARLPQEITNDIVMLISQSNQALSDFANIRTQSDVDSFNKRYNVNLVLPQEE